MSGLTKEVVMMLACPHKFGDTRKTTVIDKGKGRNADVATCALCGCYRVVYDDGSRFLMPSDGLTDKKPET